MDDRLLKKCYILYEPTIVQLELAISGIVAISQIVQQYKRSHSPQQGEILIHSILTRISQIRMILLQCSEELAALAHDNIKTSIDKKMQKVLYSEAVGLYNDSQSQLQDEVELAMLAVVVTQKRRLRIFSSELDDVNLTNLINTDSLIEYVRRCTSDEQVIRDIVNRHTLMKQLELTLFRELSPSQQSSLSEIERRVAKAEQYNSDGEGHLFDDTRVYIKRQCRTICCVASTCIITLLVILLPSLLLIKF